MALKLCPECLSEFSEDITECPEDATRLSLIEPDRLVGTKVSDRYLILEVVGRGGMGTVYKARHENLDRTVAIKMLHSHLVSDAEALKRFHREAKAVSRVKHPHTVALYDFGITPSGQPFIVMDFIEGISLKRILKSEGPLPLERANHIFQQVVDALACAHSEGVIHRDLKPENIMLSAKANDPEWVEVVDFGISKLRNKETLTTSENITRIGDVCGSPPYMSPEQCLSAQPVDTRADIYALGVVLYEAISGRLPFKARTAIEMIDCHLYAPPTPLKAANPDLAVCDSLSALLQRALQKEPEKRQQTMEEFGQELDEAIKKDAQKRQIIKHRAEVFTIGLKSQVEDSTVTIKGAEQPGEAALGPDRSSAMPPAARRQRAPARTLEGEAHRFWRGLKCYIFGDAAGLDTGPKYLLLDCPYCKAPVKQGVKFCLECGHTVMLSPTELSKLRSSQRVFSYPPTQKLDTGPAPAFSDKARVAMTRSGVVFGMPRTLFIMNLILLLLTVLYMFCRR